jgi:hypothetical protein
MYLIHLQPGRRFRVRGAGTTARLIKVNECRAHVAIEGSAQRREFETAAGEWVCFQAPGKREDWSPYTEIDPL